MKASAVSRSAVWLVVALVGITALSILAVSLAHSRALNRVILEQKRQSQATLAAYRIPPHGSLESSIGLLANRLDRSPSIGSSEIGLWKALVGLKAHLFEVDLFSAQAISNRGFEVLTWRNESWHDFRRNMTYEEIQVAVADDQARLSLLVDAGLVALPKAQVHSSLEIFVGPSRSRVRKAKYSLRPLFALEDGPEVNDALFRVEVELAELARCPSRGRSGEARCGWIRLKSRTEYSTRSGSFTLSMPSTHVFEGTIGQLEVWHHFARPPRLLGELSTVDREEVITLDLEPQSLGAFGRCDDGAGRLIPEVPAPASWDGSEAVTYCGFFEGRRTTAPPILAYLQCPPEVENCGSER